MEDELSHDEAVAVRHEEILAGLANERAHSRIRQANGQPVQWTYSGTGSMVPLLSSQGR